MKKTALLFTLCFLFSLGFSQMCPPGAGSELITNGDFEAGTTGFSTDYGLAGGSPPSVNPGNYAVWNNPNQTNSFFASMADHTAGAGAQMLIIDVDGTVGKDAYNTTVNVLPNTTYFFSAWFANINTNTSCGSCGGVYFENSPILRFSVNNTVVGASVKVDSVTHNWSQFFIAWNSGAVSGNIPIRIENIRTGSGGNDLALDDISFSTSCANIANVGTYGKSSTLPDTIFACNEAFPYVLDPQLTAGNYTFEWKNSGGGVLGTGSTYSFPSAPAAGKYYLCYDSIGDNVTCPRTDSIVFVNELKVDIQPDQHLCAPISYTINSNITAPGVNFSWERNSSPIGGNTASLAATAIGTYSLTVTKAGCSPATSSMDITEVTPSLIGSGIYCSTVTPNVATFTVEGANKINNLLDINWYTTASGGSPLGATIVNDSTISVSSPTYVSVPGCDYGLYAEDANAFNTTVDQAVNLGNETKRNASDTRTMITVRSSSLTINSIQIYQNNYSTGGTASYTVRIYNNNPSGNRCGPTGNTPNAVQFTASVSGVFPKVTTPTLRTIPVNITLPGTTAGTIYWIEIVGDEFSYFTTSSSFPTVNSPGANVLTINDVISQGCPKTEMGNIVNIDATAGKTNSCGRVFVCATTENCTAPVDFLIVNAVQNASGNLITWSTAKEKNNKQFIIQRSLDGVNFSDVGMAEGNNNSSVILSYSFTDREKLTGIVYYRIKQVDFDGAYAYSKIVSLEIEDTGSIVIYPVPSKAGEQLTVSMKSLSYQKVTITITDVIGRVVFEKTFDTDSEGKVFIHPDLSKGIYFAELFDGSDRSIVGKIIVE